MTTLGALASVFQLAAGVALAFNVFRAPYENAYRRLDERLASEERILAARRDRGAVQQAAKVVDAQTSLNMARKELDLLIPGSECWAWCAVGYSAAMLGAAALFPDCSVNIWLATLLIIGAVGPLIFTQYRIWDQVKLKLRKVTTEVDAL